MKHGLAKRNNFHPLYRKIYGMINRCYNPKCEHYHSYGGRGIKVCYEWLNNPISFVEWGLNNGWKLGLQIDRINNDGNYEPQNCRFVTNEINALNKRRGLKRSGTKGFPVGVKINENNRFVTEIYISGKTVYLGTFNTEKEASQAYWIAAKTLKSDGKVESASNHKRPYGKGVRKIGNRFYARIKVNRKEISLGAYTTQEAALQARKDYELELHS